MDQNPPIEAGDLLERRQWEGSTNDKKAAEHCPAACS
jgi:hypothetical protein